MTDPTSQDVKQIWQNQKTEGITVRLEDLRSRADRFQRRVHSRNLREYIASAIVIVLFGIGAWYMPGWMIKLGGIMIIAATIYVIWQIYRRGRPRAIPLDATAAALLAFHRQELGRQRDTLRAVGRWYLLPFVPGYRPGVSAL